MSDFRGRPLKLAVLAFWALWMSVVLATNVFDALKALGILGAGWKLASANFEFMKQVTAVYHTPLSVVAVLFFGVLVWQAAAATLHWLAFVRFRSSAPDASITVGRAFLVSTALWMAFTVIDEVFIAYGVEATHMRLLIAELVSLLVVTLVPDRTNMTARSEIT